MSASAAYRLDCCGAYRWLARISAAILAATWLIAVAWEGVPDHGVSLPLVVQLVVIATVLGGYAVALRRELVGALISLVGIAAFLVACRFSLGVFPAAGFAWFALPAVLFLISWKLEQRERRRGAE